MSIEKLKTSLNLKTEECNSMDELRSEIDQLDQTIVDMLTIRQSYMDQAARIKKSRDLVRDTARVLDVIEKVTAHAKKSGVNPDLISAIYESLIEWSINYEFKKFDQLSGE